MKNFLFIIAFLIVLTTVIVGSNPQMHKPMYIGGAKLVMQDNSNIKNTDLKVENKDLIIDETPVTVKQVEQVKAVENVTTQEVDFSDKWEQLLRIQEQEEQAKIQAEQKRQAQLQKQKDEYAKKLAQQKAQEEAKKKAEEQAKNLAEQKRLQEEQAKKLAEQKAQEEAKKKAQEEAKKKAEAEALAKKQAEEQARKLAEQEAKKKAEEQKKLVEYQENILWNQWRANVCNNVASKLDKQFAYVAPAGTVYTYSFDVDNQRRITNVVVKISRGYVNSTTQQGIFMIQNAIKSLNLSTILTFPTGSQRTTVKVSSGIERTSAQSTTINANSFNDVETITKQKYEGVN